MSSNIRIVQSALRSCRKNSLNPHKISKMIIPIFRESSNDIESNYFKPILDIIKNLDE